MQYVTIAIAVAALAVAFWSMRISRAALRHTRRATKPEVRVDLAPLRDHEGWFVLGISLRSRDDFSYRLERLTMRWPRRMKMQEVITEYVDGYAHVANDLPTVPLVRSIPLKLAVRPKGTSRSRLGLYTPNGSNTISLDHGRTSVLIKSPARSSSSSAKVSMRLALLSIDANEERITVPIVRTLSVNDTNATASEA